MRYILLESPKIRFVEPLPGSEAICHQSPQAPVNRQAPEEPVNRQSPGDRLEMNCPQHYFSNVHEWKVRGRLGGGRD